jgi:hypothetical protein
MAMSDHIDPNLSWRQNLWRAAFSIGVTALVGFGGYRMIGWLAHRSG